MTDRAKESGAKRAKDTSTSLSRLKTMKESRGPSGITWGAATADMLQRTVELLTEQGCLVSFSKTSDGGAVHLFVKDQGEAEKFFMTTEDEIQDILGGLYKSYYS